MQAQFKTITIRTEKKIQVVDITHEVEQFVSKSAVVDGICIVHAAHATAAIILNENESGLRSDLENKFEKLFADSGYKHDKIDDNAASHVASAALGNSRIVPIRSGRMIRGTWQSIMFVELDGPRNHREIVIEVLGH
jgi:secondary thiamine-phosphate synthase enzyme